MLAGYTRDRCNPPHMFGTNEHHQAIQDENGIDLAQIDHLLSLTPTERLRTLETFLEEDDALKRARDKFHDEASRIAGAEMRHA